MGYIARRSRSGPFAGCRSSPRPSTSSARVAPTARRSGAGFRRRTRATVGSVPQQPREQDEASQADDAVGDPDGRRSAELAVLRHARAAQDQRIVDKDDRQKAGDERRQKITAAEPDADRAADQDEEQAAQR